MTQPLEPGKVYRTRDFAAVDRNASRWAAKQVKRGRLRRLGHGLYYAPRSSRWGEAPPSETAVLKKYIDGPYLRTGPAVWNQLGLGTTQVEAVPLVYQQTRTGMVTLGSRRLEFRRVRFPRNPPTEYFVVDLLEHLDRAGGDEATVGRQLENALAEGRFEVHRLREMARDYGTSRSARTIAWAIKRTRPYGSRHAQWPLRPQRR